MHCIYIYIDAFGDLRIHSLLPCFLASQSCFAGRKVKCFPWAMAQMLENQTRWSEILAVTYRPFQTTRWVSLGSCDLEKPPFINHQDSYLAPTK